ncbi:MAG: hypothetical protein M3Y87_21005, partial [Myxococcota bacterium]|nr:hypothetical protein [Myxococcota bacterium]
LSPDPATVRATALRARGVSPARIDAVEAAITAARSATLPVLDADVSPTHAELFRQIVDARRTLDGALSTAGLERREIQIARAARIGGAITLAIAVVAGLAFATHEPEGVTVEASAVWAGAPAFGGETVLDGRPDTFWLLPDGTTGWVEARVSPARRVERVTVLNSHNAPHGDRATRDYRIEIYAGGRMARAIDGSFAYSTSPEPVTHEVGIDDVQRIRFVVRSHHRTGAGLAELSWE